MIDLDHEQRWYRDQLVNAAKVSAVLSRADVQQALRRCPDADGLSAHAEGDGATVHVYVPLGQEPAVADLATLCDGERYQLDLEQVLLEVPETVKVIAHITAYARLSDDERDLLRAIGKLQQETTTREYLACAA
jgi:hypothetical protein